MTDDNRAIERPAWRAARRALFLGVVSVVQGACLGSEIDVEQTPPDPGTTDPLERERKRSPEPPAHLVPCSEEVAYGLRPATELRVEGVFGYQGIEIPLGDGSRTGRVELVQGRDLLVRVFVRPVQWLPITPDVRAHLVFHRESGSPLVLEDVRALRRSSRRGDLDSTFNFYVPGDEVLGLRAFEVRLWQEGTCAGAATTLNVYPEGGPAELRARATGPVRVRIVPIRFDGDGSGRLPDVSAGHLAELAKHLAALFPVSHVELTVREPVGTTATELGDILNQLLQLRSLEEPPRDVSYYGLVNPAPTAQEYCEFGCVAGVAAFGPANGAGAAGVGIGYRGVADETFVHEVGHIHRLMHAPCGGPTGVDPSFPYRGAALGVWGYDARSGNLIDPDAGSRDFMSYCDPAWISDYNFQLLLDRLATVNGLPQTDRYGVSSGAEASYGDVGSDERSEVSTADATEPSRQGSRGTATGGSTLSSTLQTTLQTTRRTTLRLTATPFATTVREELTTDEEPTPRGGADASRPRQVFRTLRLDEAGRLRWGVPLLGEPDLGDAVEGWALDAAGRRIARFTAFRQELSDGHGALYFVPQPEPAWHSAALEGLPPLAFTEPEKVPPFVP